MLRRVAVFCRPLRPVLPLVSFPRSRSPVVGVLGLCWMWPPGGGGFSLSNSLTTTAMTNTTSTRMTSSIVMATMATIIKTPPPALVGVLVSRLAMVSVTLRDTWPRSWC